MVQASSTLARYRTAALIAASAVIAVIIASNLHSAWVVIPWLMGIGLWTAYFWHRPWLPIGAVALVTVLAAATAARLYKLTEVPLGAFVDEIFTLDSSLLLLEQHADPFGHTLQISETWGK